MRLQRVKRVKRSKKSKMSKRLQKTRRVGTLKRRKNKQRTRRTRRSQINRRRIGRMRGGMEGFFKGQPEETVIRTLLQPNITFKKLLEMRRTDRSMKQTIDRILTTPELLKEKLSTIDEKELVKLYTKKHPPARPPFYQTIAEVVRGRLNKEKQKIQTSTTIPAPGDYRRPPPSPKTTLVSDEHWDEAAFYPQGDARSVHPYNEVVAKPEGGILVSGNYVWVWGDKINHENYGGVKEIKDGELKSTRAAGYRDEVMEDYVQKANAFVEETRNMDDKSKISAKMIGIPLIVQHHHRNTAMRIVRFVNEDGSAYYM